MNDPNVDLDPPLPGYVKDIVQAVATDARQNFLAGKSSPFMAQVAPERTALIITPLQGIEDYPKLARLALMAGYAVAAAAEVWLLEGEDVRGLGTGHPPLRPALNPKRKEAIQLVLRLPEGRQVTWMAIITRNPNSLGEWQHRVDTANPAKLQPRPVG